MVVLLASYICRFQIRIDVRGTSLSIVVFGAVVVTVYLHSTIDKLKFVGQSEISLRAHV